MDEWRTLKRCYHRCNACISRVDEIQVRAKCLQTILGDELEEIDRRTVGSLHWILTR